MTIQQYKNQLVEKLSQIHSKSEAQSLAWILLEGILKQNKISLLSMLTNVLQENKISELNQASKRLLNGEPVQYVLGYAPFLSLQLKVNENVLIPRPETEELVMWIANDWKNQTTVSIIDIGTGSGCIALSLKQLMLNAAVFATDVSKNALKIAQQNAVANKLDVNFSLNDVLQGQNPFNSFFDVIVSNPPYITMDEAYLMPDNVLNYEPHIALFSNNDALTFYKAIGNFAFKYLKKEGCLYFEINEYHLEATMNCLQRIGFTQLSPKKDINGKWRMLRIKF